MKRLNKKRLLLTILSVLGIIFIISLFISKASLSCGELQYRTIYTSSGDTLWSIAYNESQNNPYYSGKDIRFIMYDIQEVNLLSNSNLQIGQRLIIPQY